jgi:hypothetical protein
MYKMSEFTTNPKTSLNEEVFLGLELEIIDLINIASDNQVFQK